MPDAVVQEIALSLNDAFRDLADGVPALLDEADEELGLVGVLAQEVPLLRGQALGA